MPSRVQVCCMALGMVGAEVIESLTADTEAARKSNLYLDQVIEEVLRAYPWNCAKVRVSLAQEVTTPAFGFAYIYSLPADCVKVLKTEYTDIAYKILRGKLYTDEDTMVVEYTARIDVNEMDGLCRSAVIAKLASYLAFSIGNSTSLREELEGIYEKALLKAAISDSQEGIPDDVDVSDFLESRF